MKGPCKKSAAILLILVICLCAGGCQSAIGSLKSTVSDALDELQNTMPDVVDSLQTTISEGLETIDLPTDRLTDLDRQGYSLQGTIDKFCQAADERDTEAIKALFSENVRAEVGDDSIDTGIEQLFDFYSGPTEECAVTRTPGGSGHYGFMENSFTTRAWISVVSQGANYYCYISLTTEDQADPDNLGIQKLVICTTASTTQPSESFGARKMPRDENRPGSPSYADFRAGLQWFWQNGFRRHGLPPSPNLLICPQYMQKANLLKCISIQGPPIRIVGVGGNQGVGQGGRISDRYDDRSVPKNLLLKTQLYKISWFQLVQRSLYPEGAKAWFRPDNELTEILHPRPSGGFFVGINVVPTKCGGKIHHTCTCIEALGGKVGAVSPDFLVVVICWIAAIGPFVSVGHSGLSVIWDDDKRQN